MNIFVGCASRDTKNAAFTNIASKVGKFIVERNHNLVFGGTNAGLMGVVYHEVLNGENSKVIVTMAEAYKDELEWNEYDEVHLSETVNERKNDILKHSDALIFLPGGIGTIDELMTSVEALRAHQFNGPIVIFNPNGFFNDLVNQLKMSSKEGLSETLDQLCYITDNPENGFTYLRTHGF